MNIKAASRFTRLALLLVPALSAAPASAQPQKQAPITGDIIIRQEWTDDFFTKPDPVPSHRTRFWIRPKFEVETSMLRMGLGVDASYSTDKNLEPEGVARPLALIRDNYLSRDIRLDLAYLGDSLALHQGQHEAICGLCVGAGNALPAGNDRCDAMRCRIAGKGTAEEGPAGIRCQP